MRRSGGSLEARERLRELENCRNYELSSNGEDREFDGRGEPTMGTGPELGADELGWGCLCE